MSPRDRGWSPETPRSVAVKTASISRHQHLPARSRGHARGETHAGSCRRNSKAGLRTSRMVGICPASRSLLLRQCTTCENWRSPVDPARMVARDRVEAARHDVEAAVRRGPVRRSRFDHGALAERPVGEAVVDPDLAAADQRRLAKAPRTAFRRNRCAIDHRASVRSSRLPVLLGAASRPRPIARISSRPPLRGFDPRWTARAGRPAGASVGIAPAGAKRLPLM